jgi:hypothetical protein
VCRRHSGTWFILVRMASDMENALGKMGEMSCSIEPLSEYFLYSKSLVSDFSITPESFMFIL